MIKVEWRQLELELRFTTPLCGGVTRNDALVEGWVEMRAPKKLPEPIGPDGRQPKSLATVTAERLETTDTISADDEMAKMWVGFSKDGTGLFVRGGNMRAHLKDCADTIGKLIRDQGAEAKPKNFKAKFIALIYVAEERLYLEGKGGAIVTEPTAHKDATMNVMTRLGPRTCLKRVDQVFPCSLRCTVQMLETKEINRDALVACLDYGKVHGFGQDRSLQFGRYEYDLGE